MGPIDSSADNALAESFNATLKRVLLKGAPTFLDQDSAYRAVFRWASRYNTRRRRRAAVGNIIPNPYQTTASTALTKAA
jgi:transposase InsO family protein